MKLFSEEQRAAGWYDVEAKFTPELKKWWSEYVRLLVSFSLTVKTIH
jgi:hypothetical protein